jgi:mycothiol synthase
MSSITVFRPAPHELMSALRIFVGSQTGSDQELRAERCRDALAAGDYDPDGLFATRNAAGRVNGAMLVQVMPGALGVAWPPRGENEQIEDALTQSACDWLQKSGVKVCQAFASSEERPDMAPLERNGFDRVTQLVFMRRDVDIVAGWGDSPGVPVRCCPWSGVLTVEQAGVLLATHEATLDCPELNGVRTPKEVLDGFSPGSPNCPWWHTIDEGAEPIGVLLFDKGPEPSVLELSYLGLIPSVRGRGLGRTALAFANRIAASSGYQFVSVSVDARNEPALRLYRRHGFVETDRREVYLAQWMKQEPRTQ